MRKSDHRVTVAVTDELTHKSFSTRAFPTGQGPGYFSAAVGLDQQVHWVHVSIREGEVQVIAGNRIPSRCFQLDPISESTVRLINGTGIVEYDVAQRYRICVSVDGKPN